MLFFWGSLVLFILVLIISNYLHFNKVLPEIKESMEMMPSEQARQINHYLESLPEEKKKGFTYRFLKSSQAIQAVMGLLLICNIIYMSTAG